MSYRATIIVEPRSNLNEDGRQSFDIYWTRPYDGSRRMQSYFANPTETVRRLRHNIASQFWFDRMRIRLAREAGRA